MRVHKITFLALPQNAISLKLLNRSQIILVGLYVSEHFTNIAITY